MVAIEFHSQDGAVDHFIDLQNTGWPSGPNQKDLKLIVIVVAETKAELKDWSLV